MLPHNEAHVASGSFYPALSKLQAQGNRAAIAQFAKPRIIQAPGESVIQRVSYNVESQHHTGNANNFTQFEMLRG